MINWIWKYRDFIKAYDLSSTAEQWIDCYVANYFKPNAALLNSIHLRPKGFASEDSAISHMSKIGRNRFQILRDSIDDFETFEKSIVAATASIAMRFERTPRDRDVYVIVGLDCTNIYSTEYKEKAVTVLCLEAVNGNLNAIKILLAHECHHWIRSTYFRENLFGNCVGQRSITEGLAINCSEYLNPGYQPYEYCFVPEKTVKWVINNWSIIEQVMSDYAFHNDIISNFFTRNITSGLLVGEPPRIGYVYGYIKTKHYLNQIRTDPIASVGLDWQAVIK